MSKRLPCLPNFIHDAPIFVFLGNNQWTLEFIVIFGLILSFSEIIFFAGYLIQNILKQVKTNKISQKTYRMQKNFIFVLIAQVTIPSILLMGPGSYMVLAALGDYYNQAMNNIVIVTVSCHGFVSTVVMITVHRPYREAVLNFWRLKLKNLKVGERSPSGSVFLIVKKK
uniref:Serpentine Receptor, class H n=1 Tax=Caenorhabditis tropicalis TaxID=1561998 RepID=A0A1I7UX06_9PELO